MPPELRLWDANTIVPVLELDKTSKIAQQASCVLCNEWNTIPPGPRTRLIYLLSTYLRTSLNLALVLAVFGGGVGGARFTQNNKLILSFSK